MELEKTEKFVSLSAGFVWFLENLAGNWDSCFFQKAKCSACSVFREPWSGGPWNWPLVCIQLKRPGAANVMCKRYGICPSFDMFFDFLGVCSTRGVNSCVLAGRIWAYLSVKLAVKISPDVLTSEINFRFFSEFSVDSFSRISLKTEPKLLLSQLLQF